MNGHGTSKALVSRVLAASVLGLMVQALGSFAAIPPRERDALMALYESTGGPSWVDSANWGGPPGSENTWYGVVTDPENTTVLEINLEGNNLLGKLPPQLSDLANLEVFEIGGNLIESALATEEASSARTPCGQNAAEAFEDAPHITGHVFKFAMHNGVVTMCKLILNGEHFQPNCVIKINGQPAPKMQYTSESEVVAKGGAKLKKMLPKDQSVDITVTNPDGQVSNVYPFTRP